LKKRIGSVHRKTGETDIRVRINLDGEGKCNIKSELPFLNHMLTLFCKHGFFDLQLGLNGDIEVDAHHSLEDLGIIKRYGFYLLVMDETLVRVAIDLSGRGRLFYQVPPERLSKINSIDGEVWKELFLALAYEAGLTLHIDLLKGENTHHMIEAIFKAFARTLDQAIQEEKRLQGTIPSSKGILA